MPAGGAAETRTRQAAPIADARSLLVVPMRFPTDDPLDGPVARERDLPGPPLDVADQRLKATILGIADDTARRAREIVAAVDDRLDARLAGLDDMDVDLPGMTLAVAGALAMLACEVAYRRLPDDVADWASREFIYATCGRVATTLRERADEPAVAGGASGARRARGEPLTMSMVHDEIVEQLRAADAVAHEDERDAGFFAHAVRRAFLVGRGVSPTAYARLDVGALREELSAMLADAEHHARLVDAVERIGAAAG